jgi:hypothetical protein
MEIRPEGKRKVLVIATNGTLLRRTMKITRRTKSEARPRQLSIGGMALRDEAQSILERGHVLTYSTGIVAPFSVCGSHLGANKERTSGARGETRHEFSAGKFTLDQQPCQTR